MRKILLFVFITTHLLGCSDKTQSEGEYPMIDIVGQVEKYQRAYCSDYFSTIELIPLETGDDFLLDIVPYPSIAFKDDLFLMRGGKRRFTFDRSGKFLHQIGELGQGPGEYTSSSNSFFAVDKPAIYVEDFHKLIEYDYNGDHITSIHTQKIERGDRKIIIADISSVGKNLFVGTIHNNGKNKDKYFIFNREGEIVKNLPNRVLFDRVKESASSYDTALIPFRVEGKLYLKDFVNDTLYVLNDNLEMKPAYVFDLGPYTYPLEYLEKRTKKIVPFKEAFLFASSSAIIGTPGFFFYQIRVPDIFSKPKTGRLFNPLTGKAITEGAIVYGIYDIKRKTNKLLDTDIFLQRGIVNDMNGGLSIFPKYYAGENTIIDLWYPEDMLEMLTDEYFKAQTIKDPKGHQRLIEILKMLKEDDNPVMVIAKMKEDLK